MARPEDNRFRQYLQYSTIGLEMGLSAAIGLGIGIALDRWLDTRPWFLIVCLIFGFAAGFRRLFGLARNYKQKPTQNSDEPS